MTLYVLHVVRTSAHMVDAAVAVVVVVVVVAAGSADATAANMRI